MIILINSNDGVRVIVLQGNGAAVEAASVCRLGVSDGSWSSEAQQTLSGVGGQLATIRQFLINQPGSVCSGQIAELQVVRQSLGTVHCWRICQFNILFCWCSCFSTLRPHFPSAPPRP